VTPQPTPPHPTHRLNDGHPLPGIGFGTYPHHGDDSQVTTAHALDAGYRLLDTALSYGNEAAVGRAVRASGLDRDDILVTTKVPGRHHGYDETIGALRESLDNLGLDRVELYLIHWPLPRIDHYVDTWRALIELRERGLTRSIGVSNFTEQHLRRIIGETGVVPAVNQIEMHPYFPQPRPREVHSELGIVTEAWSPLGRGGLLAEPAVREIAEAHGVSPAQAVLRWHLQLDVVPIPMSANAQRQRQNLDLFGFTLTEEQLTTLSGMEKGPIKGQDPDVYEEF
jgi:2,5-diketo-D-gluconate reductase A